MLWNKCMHRAVNKIKYQAANNIHNVTVEIPLGTQLHIDRCNRFLRSGHPLFDHSGINLLPGALVH